jgi:hypothetical protein
MGDMNAAYEHTAQLIGPIKTFCEPLPLYVHATETLYSHLDALAILCLVLITISTGLAGSVLYLLRKHQKAKCETCRIPLVG